MYYNNSAVFFLLLLFCTHKTIEISKKKKTANPQALLCMEYCRGNFLIFSFTYNSCVHTLYFIQFNESK